MNISAISSGMGLSIVRHLNQSQTNSTRAAEKLAAGTSMLRASDNPSMVGNVEALKSQISAKKIQAQIAAPGTAELRMIAKQTQTLQGRTELAISAGTPEALRELVNTLRTGAKWGNSNAQEVFAGDPAQKEITLIEHSATKAVLPGAAADTLITFNADEIRVDAEGNPGRGFTRMNVEVDGSTYTLELDAGAFSQEEAFSEIQNQLSAQGASVDVTLNEGVFTFASRSTGLNSSVTLSGNGASAINAAGSAKGTDAYTEEIVGANKPLKVTYNEREVSILNLNAHADQIEKLLEAGDHAGALNAARATSETLKATSGTLEFQASRLENDSLNKLGEAALLSEQLDNITALDVAATTQEMVKEQVRMSQAAWAITQLRDNNVETIRTLLGKD